MKKLFYLAVIALVASMSVSFSACSSDDDDSTELPNDSTNVTDSINVADSANVVADSTVIVADSTAIATDSTATE